MFRALLYKDYRLLQFYIRISILTSIFLYPVCFGLVYWFSETYLEEDRKKLASQVLTTLVASSIHGLILSCLFAAIIAASAIALERSDRSAEFLACLPPTRRQNLLSKLLLILSVVGGMLVLHNAATWGAWQLTAYARVPTLQINFYLNLVLTCVIVCMTGFSFAGTSVMKSNGGPALLGLLSPLLSLFIVVGIGKLLDIPSEGDMFAIRYAITCATLGVTMLLCGSIWYLNRSEP